MGSFNFVPQADGRNRSSMSQVALAYIVIEHSNKNMEVLVSVIVLLHHPKYSVLRDHFLSARREFQ